MDSIDQAIEMLHALCLTTKKIKLNLLRTVLCETLGASLKTLNISEI